jgi:hypothetical protein
MQGRSLHLAGLYLGDKCYTCRCSQLVLLIYFAQHITGRPSTEYVSEETPMAAYANVHIAFEQMRVRALRIVHGSPASEDDANANAEPPRVLVLGPENSGKTTVCKILTNYAVRAGQNWSPVLVNVDPSEVSMQGIGLFFFIESRVRVGGQFLEQSRPLQFAVL